MRELIANAFHAAPDVGAAFQDLSTPEKLRAAVVLSFAGQRQLGITKPQPLPQSDAKRLLKVWSDSPDPEEAERKALDAINDTKQRKDLAKQLDNIKAAQSETPAALGVESNADDFDDVDSERPAKFAKSIYLSPADILRLKKALMTEWVVADGEIEAKGVVDAILNRLPSGRWGNDIESVVNAWAQYSAINSENTKPFGQHDVDQLPIDDPRFDRASKFVDDYLKNRASGELSSVGDDISYGNPKYSSKSALKWLSPLKIKRGQHFHGTPPEWQKYRPGKFDINLPGDYYPDESQ